MIIPKRITILPVVWDKVPVFGHFEWRYLGNFEISSRQRKLFLGKWNLYMMIFITLLRWEYVMLSVGGVTIETTNGDAKAMRPAK